MMITQGDDSGFGKKEYHATPYQNNDGWNLY